MRGCVVTSPRMKTLRTAPALALVASFLGVLALAPSARADALPMCPPGTHMVTNPTPPGAMHHGGARCEPGGPALPTETPPEAPEAPEAPVGTSPSETPPTTPEAALPTAPASTESVPAASAEEPAPSGMCSAHHAARAGGPFALAALGSALLLARRRR